MYRLVGHPDAVYSVDFSPDGRTIASGSWGEIRLWDAEHAQEILRLAGHEWPVFKVQFGAKSASLSSGSADSTVIIWNVERPKEK